MKSFLYTLIFCLFFSSSVYSLDLDWTGEFRAESHAILNSSMESTNLDVDINRIGQGGYYIPGTPNKNVTFQTLFLKLRPHVIVNDNIFIKSEWWVGDPIYGLFGSAVPRGAEKRFYNSTYSRGSSITAQRLYIELLSEIGAFQIGRAPLHYGLGMVWNEAKGFQDRYASTGDVIRLTSKFGSFKLTPAIVKYGTGNSIVGACNDVTNLDGTTGTCRSIGGGHGNPDLTDYSIMFEYENIEEEVSLGLNFLRRVAGIHQDRGGYYGVTGTPTGINYTVWDIFAKKTFGSKFEISAEIPVVTGAIGSIKYNTWALATETKYKLNDRLSFLLKAGRAPGQPNVFGGSPDSYRAFYFHPNYKIGLIMFNYQLRNLVGPSTLNNTSTSESSLMSPFDNPVVNARYANLGGNYKTGKWEFRLGGVVAWANEVADSSSTFFNTWDRKFYSTNPGVGKQGSFLGWELDYGMSYFWDDSFTLDVGLGLFVPGGYYDFSNVANRGNNTSTVFAGQVMGAVRF